MQFTDISVDSFGVLTKTQLPDLPPGMTVVYGGNGSGKTTLVSFLRGLLFGFNSDHSAFHPNDSDFGGSASFRTGHRQFRLNRERYRGRSADLSLTELPAGTCVVYRDNPLPEWVNETVYQEIFSVGDQEAARFDLLSRLCLEENGGLVNAQEIATTERAIGRIVAERDGDDQSTGARSEIVDLNRQRDVRLRQLAQMRETDPIIPSQIADLEIRLNQIREELVVLDQRISEIQATIHRLEDQLERLKRRNTVTLDRREIESELSALRQKLNRWESIRNEIHSELAGLPQATGIAARDNLKSNESLKTIRALVSRLEERVDHLGVDGVLLNGRGELDRDVVAQHVRDEVFSLCEHLTLHQQELGSYDAAIESALTHKTSQDADQVITLIQGRIAALESELNRSDNVLVDDSVSRAVAHQPGCQSEFHRAGVHRPNHAEGSIVQIEQQLAASRHELSDVQLQRSERLDLIRRMEAELNDLKSRLKPVASLHDIDRVKADIAALDARIQTTSQRVEVLNGSERQLRDVLRQLSQQRRQPVLELATEYINRLTDGDCFRLMANETKTAILAETRQSTRAQGLQQLSRGTRDQVALALRLALIQVRSETSERCPLVLDDVFITADDERAAAVADLLMEIAAGGQQIVFFTCQNDVRSLFERRLATIRTIEETPVVSMPMPVPKPMPKPTPAPVAPPAPVAEAVVSAPTPEPEVAVSDQTNWLFYLEVDSTIDDLCGLSVAEMEALRAAEISEIDTLLTIPVDDLEDRLRQRGYSITRERIRAWRGQAELSTQIPMLRRSDAELLYASGIQNPLELSRMRPESVYDQVVAFQRSSEGQRFRRSGRQIDRQQAINWTRWSQHSRSLTDARKSRSRYFVRSTDGYNSPNDANRKARTGRSSVSSRRARISSNSGRTSVRQQRPRLSSSERRSRDERLNRRRQRLARHSASYRTHSASKTTTTERELKFYLNRSDDVEAAPSIGPKTAQRLSRADVYTVNDLLQADADAVATKLDNRRINADTIRQWQNQARLMCQVPQLRGHDVQILVACGVTEPEQLSAKRPVDLLALVGPFSETSEGERIIRGGSKPDLEEVTDWIHWAQQSRPISAAA